MPRGDRTGPNGFGQMTGRGAGFCTGNTAPGCMNPGYGRGGFGRGFGYRFGMGYARGWDRRPFFAGAPVYPGAAFYQDAPSQADELGALKEQSQYLQDQLKNINQRISELESDQGNPET
ncbi:MAG: DUF5320 domain-containing protein [Spirochaetia bacterium]